MTMDRPCISTNGNDNGGLRYVHFFSSFFLSYFTNNLYFSLVYEWITAWDKQGLEMHRALKYVVSLLLLLL